MSDTFVWTTSSHLSATMLGSSTPTLNNDTDDRINEVVDDVIVYFFATLFLGLSFITFLIALKLHFQASSQRLSIPKIVFSLLPIICFSRGIMLVLFESKGTTPLTNLGEQDFIVLVFSALPGYLTVSLYMVIVLFWVVLMYKTQDMAFNFMNTIKYIFLVINLFIYGIWIALLTKIYLSEKSKNDMKFWHLVEAYYAAGLTFAVSFVACSCGYLVYRKLHISQTKRQTLSTKTGTLAVLVTFLYAFRGVAIICAISITKDSFANKLVTVMGWAFGEFLPHMLISLVIYPSSHDGEHRKLLKKKGNVQQN